MIVSRMTKLAAYASMLGLYAPVVLAGDMTVEGNVKATAFVGSGAGLTGVVKAEVDPKVGAMAADKWCKADGSGGKINCDQNPPVRIEVDPTVGTLIAEKWCRADASGSVIECDLDAPVTPITFKMWVPNTGFWLECWDETGAARSCAGTGEDGAYGAGGRVVKPEDQQDWYPSFKVNPRFKDHGDGTVTDNLTGLVWLRNANCIADNPGYDNDGTADDGGVTWQHGLDFVRGMNIGRFNCGDTSNNGAPHTDWRMPNFNELLSLTDFTQTNPALSPGHPFLGVVWGEYWSSTTIRHLLDRAYTQGLDYAIYVTHDSKIGINYLWPVRGGYLRWGR